MKKLLSILLAFVMMVTLVPFGAFAVEAAAPVLTITIGQESLSLYPDPDSPYGYTFDKKVEAEEGQPLFYTFWKEGHAPEGEPTAEDYANVLGEAAIFPKGYDEASPEAGGVSVYMNTDQPVTLTGDGKTALPCAVGGGPVQLVLENVSFSNFVNQFPMGFFDQEPVTVTLVGHNRIASENPIHASGDLTIQGSGSLDVTVESQFTSDTDGNSQMWSHHQAIQTDGKLTILDTTVNASVHCRPGPETVIYNGAGATAIEAHGGLEASGASITANARVDGPLEGDDLGVLGCGTPSFVLKDTQFSCDVSGGEGLALTGRIEEKWLNVQGVHCETGSVTGGKLSLSVDGTSVAFPQLSALGIWATEGFEAQGADMELNVQVHQGNAAGINGQGRTTLTDTILRGIVTGEGETNGLCAWSDESGTEIAILGSSQVSLAVEGSRAAGVFAGDPLPEPQSRVTLGEGARLVAVSNITQPDDPDPWNAPIGGPYVQLDGNAILAKFSNRQPVGGEFVFQECGPVTGSGVTYTAQLNGAPIRESYGIRYVILSSWEEGGPKLQFTTAGLVQDEIISLPGGQNIELFTDPVPIGPDVVSKGGGSGVQDITHLAYTKGSGSQINLYPMGEGPIWQLDLDSTDRLCYSVGVEYFGCDPNREQYEIDFIDEFFRSVTIFPSDTTHSFWLDNTVAVLKADGTVGHQGPVAQLPQGSSIEVTLRLPEVAPGCQRMDQVKVYTRGENGVERISGVTYNKADNTVTFPTDKYPSYMVVYKDLPQDAPVPVLTVTADGESLPIYLNTDPDSNYKYRFEWDLEDVPEGDLLCYNFWVGGRNPNHELSPEEYEQMCLVEVLLFPKGFVGAVGETPMPEAGITVRLHSGRDVTLTGDGKTQLPCQVEGKGNVTLNDVSFSNIRDWNTVGFFSDEPGTLTLVGENRLSGNMPLSADGDLTIQGSGSLELVSDTDFYSWPNEQGEFGYHHRLASVSGNLTVKDAALKLTSQVKVVPLEGVASWYNQYALYTGGKLTLQNANLDAQLLCPAGSAPIRTAHADLTAVYCEDQLEATDSVINAKASFEGTVAADGFNLHGCGASGMVLKDTDLSCELSLPGQVQISPEAENTWFGMHGISCHMDAVSVTGGKLAVTVNGNRISFDRADVKGIWAPKEFTAQDAAIDLNVRAGAGYTSGIDGNGTINLTNTLLNGSLVSLGSVNALNVWYNESPTQINILGTSRVNLAVESTHQTTGLFAGDETGEDQSKIVLGKDARLVVASRINDDSDFNSWSAPVACPTFELEGSAVLVQFLGHEPVGGHYSCYDCGQVIGSGVVYTNEIELAPLQRFENTHYAIQSRWEANGPVLKFTVKGLAQDETIPLPDGQKIQILTQAIENRQDKVVNAYGDAIDNLVGLTYTKGTGTQITCYPEDDGPTYPISLDSSNWLHYAVYLGGFTDESLLEDEEYVDSLPPDRLEMLQNRINAQNAFLAQAREQFSIPDNAILSPYWIDLWFTAMRPDGTISDQAPVAQLPQGSSIGVTIQLPEVKPGFERSAEVQVYTRHQDSMEEVVGVVYNSETNTVTFPTSSYSPYLVVYQDLYSGPETITPVEDATDLDVVEIDIPGEECTQALVSSAPAKNAKTAATVAELTDKLQNSQVEVRSAQGKVLTDTDKVGTGCVVTSGNIQVVLVVMGDVDGDGASDSGDLLTIRRDLLDVTKLEGAYLKAGQVKSSNKSKVTSDDLLQIRRYLLSVISDYTS